MYQLLILSVYRNDNYWFINIIGKTKLLLTSKLPQFKNLITLLKEGSKKQGRALCSEDLHGFWDLVSIEISDVESKFTKLAQRRLLGWKPVCVEPPILTTKPTRRSIPKEVLQKKRESEMDLRRAARSRLALAKARMQETKE